MNMPESKKNTDQLLQGLAKNIADEKALIVDPDPAIRTQAVGVLTAIGVKSANIYQAESVSGAEDLIGNHLPSIVISAFEIGKRNGFELNDSLKFEKIKVLAFLLICDGSGQLTCAKSLEGDVGGSLIKPFTPVEFRSTLIQTLLAKFSPTEYMRAIEEGEKMLASYTPIQDKAVNEKQLGEIIKVFEKAKQLDPKPSLAAFYLGKIYLRKGDAARALQYYEEGIVISKPHFKCSNGIYEMYLELGQNQEAFQALRKVCQHFPVNVSRFTALIRLAIACHDLEEVEKYYQQYMTIEKKTERLTRYMCAALTHCGLQYLHNNSRLRASELFQKAASVAGPRTKILRNLVTMIVDAGVAPLAEELLQFFPAQLQGTPDFLAVNLLVFDAKGNSHPLVIARGRELISRNIEDPVIYQLLIQRSLQSNLKDNALEYYQKALKKYPEEKEKFDAIMAGKEQKFKVFDVTWDEMQ